jgi:uncharacterized protein involved in exopolysaccharide biosynthesis
MTASRTPPDLDAEREVDLGRWRSAVAARWWLLVIGLVVGAVLGLLASVGGSQVYRAQALISLGQPFSPTGSAPVNSFATNPRAVSEIVRSESALKQAAAAAGLHVGALRGKVSSGQVGTGTGTAAARNVPLVNVSVTGAKPGKVEAAANELAKIVVDRTTAKYVGTKIRTFNDTLKSIQERLDTLAPRIKILETAIEDQRRSFDERLLLVTQLDNAQERRGQLLDLQTTTQQQLALALNVESAQIVQKASAAKTTARSRRNSIAIGALIGLLAGLIAAIAWDPVVARRMP